MSAVQIDNRLKKTILAMSDVVLTETALFLGLWLRFGGSIPDVYFGHFEQVMWTVAIIHLAAFFAFGVYRRLWHYYRGRDYGLLGGAVLAGVVVFFALTAASGNMLPRSVYLMYGVMLFAFAAGFRFILRKAAELDEVEVGDDGGS